MKSRKLDITRLSTSRRRFLRNTAAFSAVAVAGSGIQLSSAYASTPKRGGLLKVGMAGGTTADSMDPSTTSDVVGIFNNFTTYNCLAELDANRNAIPELAESWEARPGAREWIFTLRRGIEFHNGKTMNAGDVVYSINRHRGEDSTSGAKAVVSGINDISIISDNQILVKLDSPNADLPYAFTDYHISIVPEDFSDWSNPIGTGPYRMETYDPGVRMESIRNENYWKPDRAHVDRVELTVINDQTARISALRSGAVHAINQVDPTLTNRMKEYANIQTASSGKFFAFCMHSDVDPFTSPHVRNALKFGINRQLVIDTILSGHSSFGNDHPIPPSDPFFHSELPQREFDADRAKWHLKQAGLDSLAVDLSVAESGFAGAVDTGVLYQETAKEAGITINLVREPDDGYWSNVWLIKPFCAAWWSGRPTADLMFTVTLKSDGAWNETHFRNEAFDRMLIEARGELNNDRRRELYWTMQELVHNESGYVIPVFPSVIDGYDEAVQGVVEDHNWGMMGMRLAERAWLV